MKKDRDPSPEAIEERLLEAYRRGSNIEDLEYDEVTGLLDVVLARTKRAADAGAQKIHEVTQTLSRTSGTNLRRVG